MHTGGSVRGPGLRDIDIRGSTKSRVRGNDPPSLISAKVDCRSRAGNVASTDQLSFPWPRRRTNGASCPLSLQDERRPWSKSDFSAITGDLQAVCTVLKPADLLPHPCFKEKSTTSLASDSINSSSPSVSGNLRWGSVLCIKCTV